MATILKQFDWTYVSRNSAVPRSRAYPWNEWLDGRIWQLEPGTDFDGPPVSLERVIRTTANRRGIKVRVRITDEGNVIVQKHEGDITERCITKSPSLRSIKAAREATPPLSMAMARSRRTPPARPRRRPSQPSERS
jgi:hypothetical protein